MTSLQAQGEQISSNLQVTLNELEKERRKLMNFDVELEELSHLAKQQSKEMTDCQVELQERTRQQDQLTVRVNEQEKELKHLLKEHVWIQSAKDQFGRAGGRFDFAAQDMRAAAANLAMLETQQDQLRKSINMTVMNTLDLTEKRERELRQKMAVVVKDKYKIQETIAELEKYKCEALEKTWTSVNTCASASSC